MVDIPRFLARAGVGLSLAAPGNPGGLRGLDEYGDNRAWGWQYLGWQYEFGRKHLVRRDHKLRWQHLVRWQHILGW